MNHDQWLERAEMYALGALDVEEATQFEAHLASRCGLCEDHLRETREALTLVPRSLTPVNPPPAVKAQLLAQIAGEAAPVIPVRPRPRWVWWGMSAGAFAAAGLLITLSWSLVTTRQEIQTLKVEQAKQQGTLTLYTAVINLLRDPSTRDVALRGVGPGAGAAGRFLWSASGEGHIFVANLPPPTEGKAYVVWTIAPGKPPRSAGVIKTDASGSGGLHVYPGHSDHPVEMFAVTLEPSGDVSAPTGPTVLVSN
jgi:anti-sigma-K factor RskA